MSRKIKNKSKKGQRRRKKRVNRFLVPSMIVVFVAVVITVLYWFFTPRAADDSEFKDEARDRRTRYGTAHLPERMQFVKERDIEGGRLKDALYYLGQVAERFSAGRGNKGLRSDISNLVVLCQDSDNVFSHLSDVAKGHKDARLREVALLAIAASRRSEGRSILMTGLKDEDFQVRVCAVASLGMVPASVRKASLKIDDLGLPITIGAIQDLEEVKVLADMLSSENNIRVKDAIVEVLSHMDKLPQTIANPLFDVFRDKKMPESTRFRVLKMAGGDLNGKAIATLCEVVEDIAEKTHIRSAALKELQSRIEEPTVFAAVKKVLENPQESKVMRFRAATIMCKANPDKRFASFARVAQDPKAGRGLRLLAIEFLPDTSLEEKADVLTVLVREQKDESIVTTAFGSLKEVGGNRALEAAFSIVEGQCNERLKIEAIDYIAINGGKPAAKRLERLTTGGATEAVKVAVSRAIERINESQ